MSLKKKLTKSREACIFMADWVYRELKLFIVFFGSLYKCIVLFIGEFNNFFAKFMPWSVELKDDLWTINWNAWARNISSHVFTLMGQCLSIYLEGLRKTTKRLARSVQRNGLYWNMRTNKMWAGSENMFSAFFYVHVTVHRNKFLYNNINQMHKFPKFTPAWNSMCFRQFLCPSTGVHSLYSRDCAECTMNKLLMMGRGTARNI
jgi:hypothetical protein